MTNGLGLDEIMKKCLGALSALGLICFEVFVNLKRCEMWLCCRWTVCHRGISSFWCFRRWALRDGATSIQPRLRVCCLRTLRFGSAPKRGTIRLASRRVCPQRGSSECCSARCHAKWTIAALLKRNSSKVRKSEKWKGTFGILYSFSFISKNKSAQW